MSAAGVDESAGAAEWGEAVDDREIADVEEWLGAPLPGAWRAYVQRERWFRRGWLRSGAYLILESPRDARSMMEAWDESLDLHPGFYQLGTDGSRLIYCVDLRDPDAGVLVTDIVAEGWEDADRLGLTVEEFVGRLDDGTLEPQG